MFALFARLAQVLIVLASVLLAVVVISLVIVALVWVVSGAIQWVGNALGYEVGSLWSWFKSKLPFRRKE